MSLGKSVHHCITSTPLRMVRDVVDFSMSKQNALSPSRMDVNSGKSIHYSSAERFTLKHHTLAFLKCMIAALKGLQSRQIYSIHSSRKEYSQIRRKGIPRRIGLQMKAISVLASLFITSFPFPILLNTNSFAPLKLPLLSSIFPI